MRTQQAKNIVKKFLVISLLVFGSFSCTYDYFEDESNFIVYVPQIEDGTIDNFYIAIHDAQGNHLVTRKFEAPFDKNDLLKQGIIRFKLPRGDASVSCFANYDSNSTITEGEALTGSYKSQLPSASDPNVYISTDTQPRANFIDVLIYPLGHPSAKQHVEVDMDTDKIFKGRVICRFEDLPSSVTDLHIFYTGNSTQLGFDGIFREFSTNDRLYAEAATGPYTTGNIISYPQYIYPSTGVSFLKRNATYVDSGEEIGVEIIFYNGTDIIGSASFQPSDLAALSPDKRPVDGNGNPVTNLILYPQQTIIFTFKGFTIIKIELEDWGDIIPGETTPM